MTRKKNSKKRANAGKKNASATSQNKSTPSVNSDANLTELMQRFQKDTDEPAQAYEKCATMWRELERSAATVKAKYRQMAKESRERSDEVLKRLEEIKGALVDIRDKLVQEDETKEADEQGYDADSSHSGDANDDEDCVRRQRIMKMIGATLKVLMS
ncbi:hypothetical protein QR680_007448 [Steinernema hermaphroditum]|uniref:Uncharacterized protein n=1 Tax=Steinernema hermaphroditum TaxID=289476 RepID=A0AA39IFD9_9BILA|nr:hypothetical protein QR680_007448 [Steinernema hermaphroditum]